MAQPVAHGRSGDRSETAGESTTAHPGLFGQHIDIQRMVKVQTCPIEHRRDAFSISPNGQRQLGILCLAALTMRWHHHAPCHAAGDLGAVPLPHEVQAAVDAGSNASLRQHIAINDIQHLAVHPDTRVAATKFFRPQPVGGGRAPIQNAGGGQHERPKTQPNQTGAAFMGNT